MRLDDGQIEVMDEAMARVLRAKSGTERLVIAEGLLRSARRLIEASVRARHPDWDAHRVREETARRLALGDS